MILIDSTWGKLSSATKLIIIGVVVVFISLLLWLYGMNAANGISGWWFQRGVNQSQKEIQQYKDLAAETLRELQAEKEITAAERAKREAAEKILADKSLNADQKLKKYAEEINKIPITSAPADTASLCTRAQALGIRCD